MEQFPRYIVDRGPVATIPYEKANIGVGNLLAGLERTLLRGLGRNISRHTCREAITSRPFSSRRGFLGFLADLGGFFIKLGDCTRMDLWKNEEWIKRG